MNVLFFFLPPPFEQVPLYGEATRKSWGALRACFAVSLLERLPVLCWVVVVCLFWRRFLASRNRTAIRIDMWHDRSTEKLKSEVGRGVGRCTYMVKPPGVFPERFVRAVGEGEQAGAPKWWIAWML